MVKSKSLSELFQFLSYQRLIQHSPQMILIIEESIYKMVRDPVLQMVGLN